MTIESEPILIARFTIRGEPISKSRARFTKRGSKTFAYTPQKTLDGEHAIRDAYLSEAAKGIDPEAAFCVRAHFFNGTRQRRDVDNMLKLVLDGLNKIAWPDDSQVVEVAGRKSYVLKDDARTEIEVYRVGGLEPPTQPCIYCGTPFRTYESWKSNPNGKKYCSRECVYQHRMDKKRRTCRHCGKEFCRWGESKETIYCSMECLSADKRATVSCSQCGTEFTKQRCHVRATNYCSTDCRIESAKSRRSRRYPGICRICGSGTTRKEYTRCNPCKVKDEGVAGRAKP